jgi:hypothetical protein
MFYLGSGSEHFSIPDPREVKIKTTIFLLLMVSGASFNSQKILLPGSGKIF